MSWIHIWNSAGAGSLAAVWTKDFDKAFESISKTDLLWVKDMSSKRFAEFVMGRYCARIAIRSLGGEHAQLNRLSDGSVEWPAEWIGSISHSQGVAVALVGSRNLVQAIGVDIEPLKPLPREVAQAFTDDRFIGRASKLHGPRLRVGFSAREAAFKALSTIGYRIPILAMKATIWTDGPDDGHFVIEASEWNLTGVEGKWCILDRMFHMASVVIPASSKNIMH